MVRHVTRNNQYNNELITVEDYNYSAGVRVRRLMRSPRAPFSWGRRNCFLQFYTFLSVILFF